MATVRVPLYDIAHARSGDKGSSSNIGVIAYTAAGYGWLRENLSAEMVESYFKAMGVTKVTRYELPNLGALNFLLAGILAGGGSRSLRIDAQGKALGQALLELKLEMPEEVYEQARRPWTTSTAAT